MAKLRFLKVITVDGVEYGGTAETVIVDEKDIAKGSVESLLYTKSVERIEDPRKPEAFREPEEPPAKPQPVQQLAPPPAKPQQPQKK